ncbi:MAG TPA: AraC family transcriptional regulator [Syntrophomonas sp.]|nr:AraC family transcriptional regulator [Syntrophomonas sp.]
MSTVLYPKAWESLLNESSYFPVVVKTIKRYYDISWSMNSNRHEFFEMVYVKKGNAVFEIAQKPLHIGPNDIIIIKPNQLHKLTVKSEAGCEFIVLNFSFATRNNIEFSKVPLKDFLNFVSGQETGEFIKLKVSQKNNIILLLNKIIIERECKDLGSEFLNSLMVLELFVLISRALKMEWEDSIKLKSPKVKELIEISVNYIDNNFERNISLGDIAQYVFLSPSYFTKAFKDEMGISPISYLLKKRIERAKELLTETDTKICDIALSIGFSNQQRFSELFKKYTAITPLQYTKKFKKNVED